MTAASLMPIVAIVTPPDPQSMRLFRDVDGTVAIVIFSIFLGGLLTWIGFAVISYLRRKRLDQLPPILGEPDAILDQLCSIAGLGISHRHLLHKVAFRMRLPQPASILLSPELLVQAARKWKDSHRFGPTKKWGLHKLDYIARQVFDKSLHELGYRD